MKKFEVSLLVVLLALGLMVLFSGCGDDGDGGLPQSSAVYEGSSDPAVLGTTESRVLFDELYEELGDFFGMMFLDYDIGTTTEVEYDYEGTEGGTVKWVQRMSMRDTPTEISQEVYVGEFFDGFADDGSTYEGVLAGDGNWEYWYEWGVTTTGEEGDGMITSLAMGDMLTDEELYHVNYNDYYCSGADWQESTGGFAQYNYSAEATSVLGMTYMWESEMRSNVGFNDLFNEEYLSIDASAAMAWDGSVTTMDGGGEICDDGFDDYGGCFDVTFDGLTWDEDGEGGVPGEMPISGTMMISAAGTTIMFEYGVPEGCLYTFSVDSDSDGEFDDFEYENCP